MVILGMKDLVSIAKERAEAFNVKNVVVATNSGSTANLVLNVFSSEYNIYAVGNPSPAHEKGLVHHSGISEETRRSLEKKGINVILQDQSLFQAMDIGLQGFPIGEKEFVFNGCFHGSSFDEVVEKTGLRGEFNAVAIVYNTLNLFSTARVCIEVALMAADSGLLSLDEDCISIAQPSWTNTLPGAAVILRPARTQGLFKRELRVKDLVLVPGSEDAWFNNGPVFW